MKEQQRRGIRSGLKATTTVRAPARITLAQRLSWVERGLAEAARALLDPSDMMARAKLMSTLAVLDATNASPSEEEPEDGLP